MTRDDPRALRAHALLSEDRAALLLSRPFIGQLAMHLDIVVGDFEDPLSVDGRALYFDVERTLALPADERRFLVVHGVWHCALLHPFRRAGRDPEEWDRAADAEINAIVAHDWPIPASVPLSDGDGLSAEQIYAGLDPAALPPRGPLADAHWPPPEEQTLEASWMERVTLAMQGAERAGEPVPGAIQKIVAARARKQTPWRSLLRAYVTDTVGDARVWVPPNRRHVHRGLFLPSRRSSTLRLAVLLDTSGSTADVQPAFLGELAAILRSQERYELLFIQGDAAVQSAGRYDSEHPWVPGRTHLQGFGGTSFVPAFDRVEKEVPPPSVLVVLTDGQGEPPRRAPRFPVIWALSPGGDAPVPWGRRVCLATDDERGNP